MVYWRIFDAADNVPDDVVFYNPRTEISHIRLGKKRPVACFIDGACRANGKRWARAAFGVYHGPDSSFNLNDCLPDDARHTSQAAEIYAAQMALDDVWENVFNWGCHQPNRGLVIITDSDYLVRSMTEYVYHWDRNGWLNAKGQPVVNGFAFQSLHNTIATNWEQNGRPVRFWHVPREQNCDADRLASNALDYA